MTEEALDLDELIQADKQTEKRENNNNNGNNNTNKNGGNRRNNHNNNNSNRDNNNEKNYSDESAKNNSGKRIYINRNNKQGNNSDHPRNNERKYSGRDDADESPRDDYYQVKKVHKTISKNRSDDTDPQQEHPPRQLAITQAKKVNVQKKFYVVKVENLQCTTPPHEIYELASQNEEVAVESISIEFNCAEDSKLIEAEITYLNKADAETFIKNYNEAKLDDQELKIYLL